MPILTIEALRENPWNVMSRELPPRPAPVLVTLALMAAHYGQSSEEMLAFAARHGEYTPAWWKAGLEAGEVLPDVHEESEERAYGAERKFIEICRRLVSGI